MTPICTTKYSHFWLTLTDWVNQTRYVLLSRKRLIQFNNPSHLFICDIQFGSHLTSIHVQRFSAILSSDVWTRIMKYIKCFEFICGPCTTRTVIGKGREREVLWCYRNKMSNTLSEFISLPRPLNHPPILFADLMRINPLSSVPSRCHQ